MHLKHNFYVVVDKKNAVQKMHTRDTNTMSLYRLNNVLLSFLCFQNCSTEMFSIYIDIKQFDLISSIILFELEELVFVTV